MLDGVAGERLKNFEVQEQGASLVGMKVLTPNKTLVKSQFAYYVR